MGQAMQLQNKLNDVSPHYIITTSYRSCWLINHNIGTSAGYFNAVPENHIAEQTNFHKIKTGLGGSPFFG
jgi:hypothetical protein